MTRRNRLAVGAAGLAIFSLGLDGSMLVSSLPAVGRGLGLSPTTSVWLLLAATMPMIGLTLPLGAWVDLAGRRAAFFAGATGYATAAIAVGLAPALAWIVGARAVEGSFAALLNVLVFAVAATEVPPRQRPVAIGVVTAAGTLGSIAGPQLGALMLPALGWRAVFLASPPLMLAAAAMAAAALPGTLRLPRPRPESVVEGGALTLAVGGFFLLLRTPPFGLRAALLAAGMATAVIAGLGAWSRLPPAAAIFRLVSERSLSAPLLGLGSMTFGVGVMAFAVPFTLLASGESRLWVSALAFTFFAFGQGLSAAASGPAARRLGSWPVAVAGTAAMAAAMLSLLPLDPGWGPVGLTWRVGLVGLASGIVAGCDQALVMSLAPARSAGAASAVSGLLRSLLYSSGAAAASAAAWLSPNPTLGIRAMLAVAAVAAGYSLLRKLAARRLLAGADAEVVQATDEPALQRAG